MVFTMSWEFQWILKIKLQWFFSQKYHNVLEKSGLKPDFFGQTELLI